MGKLRHHPSSSLLVRNQLSEIIADATLKRLGRRGLFTQCSTFLVVVVILMTLAVQMVHLSNRQDLLREAMSQNHPWIGLGVPDGRGERDKRVVGVEGEDGHGRLETQHQVDSKGPQTFVIDVESNIATMTVSINDKTIFEGTERGIHAVVLHQITGRLMAHRAFDTYIGGEDGSMKDFLDSISDDRIIVFGIKDDGAFQLGQIAREYITWMGSKQVQTLSMRDLWAMVVVKGGTVLGETYSKSNNNIWGSPARLHVKVPVVSRVNASRHCEYQSVHRSAEEDARRRAFCEDYEGYGNVCSCNNPDPITFQPLDFPNNNIKNIPVAVVAGNRPHYLSRTLVGLLTARGVNPKMITVFIDGYPKEVVAPMAVAKLFGVQGIQSTPVDGTIEPSGKIRRTARITQHYRKTLTTAFNMHPSAKYLIIVEEDLEVSPDFFSYFSQTMHLLEEDESLICISAWNDNAYEHSSSDPSMVYRVETMPGLGWMLKRKIYKEELEPIWPPAHTNWDWDMWMRQPERIKRRECIIPDISRTFHFGEIGVNVNKFFHNSYFKAKPRNRLPYVQLKDVNSLQKYKYEELIENIIRNGTVLDHTKDPCVDKMIPDGDDNGKNFIMYIQSDKGDNKYMNWQKVAKCFKIWDLGSRGHHKSMWRIHLNGRPVMIIGTPKSPYSKFKPPGVTPISLWKPEIEMNKP